jgi:hypothetical protein
MRRLLTVVALALLAPAPAFASDSVRFKAKRAGEARLAITASAPGTDWGRAGSESAVATVTLDGRYSQDVVGTALAVQLRGGDRWYTSHHDVPDWSIQRDDPAATTIELPPGTESADVAAVKAIAVPVAKTSAPPAPAPADYAIHVRRINRGFLLDDAFLPQPSFLRWTGDAVLTPASPEAVLWQAG